MSVLEREVLDHMAGPKDPSYRRGQMLPADALGSNIDSVLHRASSEDLVVFKDNEPKVAMVNIDRYEALRSLEVVGERFEELRLQLAAILAITEAGTEPKLIGFDELMDELGLTEDDLEC